MPSGNSLQTPDKGNSVDQLTHRPLDRSDFIKLGAAGALYLLTPKAAKAALKAMGPPGAKEVNEEEDYQEGLKLIDGRWEGGILVLKKGKTSKQVMITESPHSYALAETNGIAPFSNRSDGDFLYLIEPYLISNFDGRTFAVVYDQDHYMYGFLDLAWAMSNGTLGSLAIKENGRVKKPERKPFKFGQDFANQPVFSYGGTTPDQGYALYQDGRGNEKKIYFVPSKALPKTKTRR